MAVLECKNLKKTDTFGSTDGYVEVSLLPHKEKMDKTKTIKSSANPVWNQTFTYQVNTRAMNLRKDFTITERAPTSSCFG